MSNSNSHRTPLSTPPSILNDLGFNASEALEIAVKAQLYRGLFQYIEERGFSQQQLGPLLGIHQPDVSSFLSGKVSRFSVSKLLRFASKLHFRVQIKLTRRAPKELPNSSNSTKTQNRRVRSRRTLS